jgi:VanZ family protein
MKSQAGMTRTLLTIGIVVYLAAMFAGTHVPRIPAALEMPGGDKWQHFAAYGGLGFLLAARQFFGKPWVWSRAAKILGVIAVYAALDELSQIPVGRDAELFDWVADVIGAAGGIAAYAALISLVRGRRKQ